MIVGAERERREELLDQFEKSKLSGQKFAKLTGIKYSTFCGVGEQASASAIRPGSGLAVARTKFGGGMVGNGGDQRTEAPPSAAGLLLVRLPSGAAIELANVSQAPLAAAVLRAWEKTPC